MNYNKNMGKLEIIMGTMFSGKTSYLLNKIALFVELNLKVPKNLTEEQKNFLSELKENEIFK